MKIRDRIKEFRRVSASELRPNPKNWRSHPDAQKDALRGLLAEVGFADAVLARELEDGSLMLIDGHLRVDTMGNEELPVLILDVDADEADKILATLDPLAAMAERDETKLQELVGSIDTESDALQALLDELAPSMAAVEVATTKSERVAGEVESGDDDEETPEAASNEAEPRADRKYGVLVEAADEDDQEAIHEALLTQGYTCKPVTI